MPYTKEQATVHLGPVVLETEFAIVRAQDALGAITVKVHRKINGNEQLPGAYIEGFNYIHFPISCVHANGEAKS